MLRGRGLSERRASALARCLQHRVTEEGWLSCSWAFPKRAALCRNRDRAQQRRDHRARKDPIRGQGEMELRAGTCLEGEQTNERSFFIEQAATTRTRFERGRSADDVAAVVSIQSFDDSIAKGEIASAGKAGGDNAFPGPQRLRRTNGNRGQPKLADADEAEIVCQAAGLDRGDPALATVRDFDGPGFARDMAGGRQQVGRDDHARAEALRAVGGDGADLHQAVREVVGAKGTGRYAGDRRGKDAQQPSQGSPRTLRMSHEYGHSRNQAMSSPTALGDPQPPANYLVDKGYGRPRQARETNPVREKRPAVCTGKGRDAPLPHRFGCIAVDERERADACTAGATLRCAAYNGL